MFSGFALGSTRHTLVLLDTEGLGDVDKGDSKNDAWIFCLAVLLSSTLVYNSRGTIDNTALEQLHFVTELAEQIKIKSPAAEEEEEDSQFVQFFPNFIWTVRDFSLELVIEKKGRVTEDEYMDFALQLKKVFGHLVQSYVGTISSGNLPCLENAVVVMARIVNEAAVQEGLKLYKSWMEQEVVEKHYAELIAQNMEASEQKCQQILSHLYEEMNVHVQRGEYAKPGGYKLYCTQRDSIITQYHSQPNKGIQAEVVLERFRSEKSVEAKLIIQTDEQLTESEKNIQEEKEQAALLEQQCKVAQKRKLEMEQLMQEERENHVQRLQQLERKFDEEKLQQQQEQDRALDSKLAEHEELMTKGFKEKAQMLELEIEQLKEEKNKQSGSVFKDYVMPFVDTAKEVFSTYLQYKILRKSLASPVI
ncbi:hypothetical protein AMELA_G00216770 [Ameiurus melas]|uniref:GB1/RHD3-type G domain-containing protein n=1 Tax=Ameiurus melas TaxID=219545 RepID=A0A7J6A3S5_AMEME|nr:hypothetical protein AMELA_G00216770 [Ameiurus melas]